MSTVNETIDTVIESALRRELNTRRWNVIKVGLLAACFVFIAATSLGIQLSNRMEGRARTEQLEKLDAQADRIELLQEQSQETLDKIESVTGPEARREILDVVDQIVARIDCNDRAALQAVLDAIQESGIPASRATVRCAEVPDIGG